MTRVDPIPALKRQLGGALAPLVSGWNGDDIAYLLQTDRSRIAELRREKLDRFSLETLIRYLSRLDGSVEIKLTPPPPRARPR
jgi:predicted XRE-type DNA-binding protein